MKRNIGILLTGPADRLERDYIVPFTTELERLMQAGNTTILRPYAEPKGTLNSPEEMKRHARALVDRQPDVIWVLSTEAARAAIQARREAGKTDDIAIVGAAVSSVIRGLAQSAGNFSGIINTGWDLGDDRFRFLQQIMRDRLRKVGVLVHPHEHNSSSEGELVLIKKAAQTVSVIPAYIESAADVKSGLEYLKSQGADAVMTTHMPIFQHERQRIVSIAKDLKMPVAGHRSFFVDEGALMAYSSVLSAQMKQSAKMVYDMLSTDQPDPTRFEEPGEFELVVNSATARLFNLSIPGTWEPKDVKVRTI
jgi:ABC-type uncharacterized transport system substrate-binding protein